MVRIKFGWLVLVLVLLSLACSLGGQTEEPQLMVEISTPVEGAELHAGEEVFVVASAVASEGVDKVYITVNGEILGFEQSEDLPPAYVTNFGWTPEVEGDAVLAVVAVAGDGQTSEPVSINLQIVSAMSEAGDGGEGTAPTNTVEPPTNTPEPSSTHQPTATFTPVPPTDTPTVTPSPTSGGLVIVTLPGIIVMLPSVETVWNQTSIANNDTTSVTVTCPSGSVVMSGGFATNPGVYVYTHNKSGNGWRVFGSNKSGGSAPLTVFAVCASNIAGASVQQVHTQVTAPANNIGHAVVSCPGGTTVVGGGYASKSDHSLRVYNSTKKDNGWQVYASNSKASGQLLNAYAICLSANASTSSTHVWESVSIGPGSTGWAASVCAGGWGTGGGFAHQSGLLVYNSSPDNSSSWEGYAKNTLGSSRTMNVYTICLTFD